MIPTTLGALMTSDVVTASPWESVAQAAARMTALGLGALPAVDQGRIAGLLTRAHVITSHPNRLVADAMDRHPLVLGPEVSVWEARAQLQGRSDGYVLVAEGQRLLGVIRRHTIETQVARCTDVLTDLPTPPYLLHVLTRFIREGEPVGLLFLDLDEFGMYNKRLGHDKGDLLLRQVAHAFAATVGQQEDVLCRYGGDEFAVATTRNRRELEELARSLIAAVQSMADESNLRLSVSVGLAARPSHPIPSQQAEAAALKLINLASRASTEAKETRRQLVTVEAVSA